MDSWLPIDENVGGIEEVQRSEEEENGSLSPDALTLGHQANLPRSDQVTFGGSQKSSFQNHSLKEAIEDLILLIHNRGEWSFERKNFFLLV